VILKLLKLFSLILICTALLGATADEPSKVSRIITVRDGLPQSYISGVFQDKNGFLWISTLNGLGRYDGRGIKRYHHTSADTAGISENIILYLFPIGDHNILLCYQSGKIDQLNTVTGKVIHHWKNKNFEKIVGESKKFRSLINNGKDICWIMSNAGGVYRMDLSKGNIHYFAPSDLKIAEPIIGLSFRNNKLLLLTEKNLLICNSANTVEKKIPFPFQRIVRFKEENNVYSPSVRTNGDLIITDATGIKIWNPFNGFFKEFQLPHRNGPGKQVSRFDQEGNYYFEFNHGIFMIKPSNVLLKWEPAFKQGLPTSMFTDKSGVLWVGTNGFGLRQYNLKKTGLPGHKNQRSFVIDVLSHAGFPTEQIDKTFLGKSIDFANRSTIFNDSIWITDIYKQFYNPQLGLYVNKKFSIQTFRTLEPPAKQERVSIRFITTTKKGALWGIDNHHQLVRFNSKNLTFLFSSKTGIDASEQINGMVAESEDTFYISSNKSLVKINTVTGEVEELIDFLPSKDLLHICNGIYGKDILWIGTLSDGLIKFNKKTKKALVYSTATGLPNNTIYSILVGNDNLLWCSSNKGIFSFNPQNQAIRSFTSRDGLTDDEFNRYYHMKLPGGNLAFGGPVGYSVFNPSKLEIDAFNPKIVLTDLNVINMPNLNNPMSTFKELHLKYDQNFITAVFAAMQFDLPEKLQYRYKLIGLDEDWIMLGNENKASYTSLPAGKYTLLLNATNTAGKWSTDIPRIDIIIFPPFWKTWWFYLASALALFLVIYAFVDRRIRSVKKAQAQKLKFERDAMELHAIALRARMNPHFIFNCMNSIKALIQEKHNQKAINYLTTFSILIRKQLNNNSNEIALEDELETCKLYLELEAMRFEDRINFQIQIEDDDDLKQTKVPPLILQPIVENAIVHGLLPSEKGGLVSIRVYREENFGVCRIEDNGVGRAAAELNKQKSSRLHQSKGIHLLEERITMHNRINDKISSLETIDLFNSNRQATGTLVIIKFNLDL
jgi:ligand-binding sensor domain-containing protein